MQTLLGFWAIQIPSSYITRSITIFCADDGYGNLIWIPSESFPVHAINTKDQ